MTTLGTDLSQDPEGGDGERMPSGPPERGRRSRPAVVASLAGRWGAPLTGLPRLAHRHLVFTIALGFAVALRLVAMLGFLPAVLFRLDTYDYLWGAAHLSPNVANPSGYSLFLWLLLPLHSLVLVAALQHLLGLVTATLIYALVRRHGLPAWGATLAAAPVLFAPSQILLEQLIMADLLGLALMVGAFAVLLMRTSPSALRSATAGLMMGASVIVRPTTAPLIILIPAFLLARRLDWRRAGAALLAGAVPVLGYVGWFAAVHGSFNMTNSNGLFLWSRTMSFANCSVIKPPAGLRALCPSAQPGALAQPVAAKRLLPKRYLWNHRTWAWQPPAHQFVPDTAAFTKANNARALRFAFLAIKAQPAAYATVVVKESEQAFLRSHRLRFPATQPQAATLGTGNTRYAEAAVNAYTGDAQGVAPYLGYHYGGRLQQPFAGLMNTYQNVIFLPGPVLGLIVLAGLAGIVIPRRRTAAAVLLWASAMIIFLLPTAEHEYTYRYVIPAVPLLCIAAALAFRKPGTQT